jgi:alpha 1,2-mannosyltransferase
MSYCVLTLARLNNNDLNNLILNLNQYFIPNNPNIDLLVFIEKKDKCYINDVVKYNGKNIIFHEIEDFDSNINYKQEISEKVFGFGLSYRLMCRFFSGELFKILKLYNYTYYLRLDTDSRFTELVRDLFTEFTSLDMSYGYITILNEPPEVTLLLVDEVKSYLKNKDNIQNYIIKDHSNQLNFCYYNNFEIVKISEFIVDNHIDLYEHLDKTNGFIKYRWGDALFRFIYVNLFIPQNKIYYFYNVGYHHKFQLKNTPFKFIDWDIKSYRENNTVL